MDYGVYVAILLIISLSLGGYRYIRNRKYEYLKKEFIEKLLDVSNAITSFQSIIDSEGYISKGEYTSWLNQWEHIKPSIFHFAEHDRLRLEFEEIGELASIFKSGTSLIDKDNERYITWELESYRDFFDSIEAHPLTESQRRAIVTNERNTLVVAGAGTGKTSTIIGKAGYIVKKGLAEPNEVLLFSFARDARDEMDERVLSRLNQRLPVYTFHSLGLNIIATVEGRKPSISELSTDKAKLNNAVSRFIKKRSEDIEFLSKLNEYFVFHRTPYKSEYNFESMGEYIDFLRNHQVRSLKGDLVKSLEECEIANFLYLKGVNYVYEANYEVETVSIERRQYKPDFYLPEYGVYIEHFGVDKNNNTSPFVDREKYLKDMEWKRQIHRVNGTKLIETYSWMKSEGLLQQILEKELSYHGVEFDMVPPERIFDRLNELGLVHPFSVLLSTFLNLYKSSGKSIAELYEQAKGHPDYSRSRAFLELFSEIMVEYNKALGDEIDFNDMINRAEAYVSDGRYSSRYKYILVDEFQDISYSRYRLLKALLDDHPDSRLFCVGDDWQSIYRFTGSDISIMINFDQYFDPSEMLTLDRTFRFDDKLCGFSTRFILKNPSQIRKKLATYVVSDEPSVTLYLNDNLESTISEILLNIDSANPDSSKVFILGRYKHQRLRSLSHLRARFPRLEIDYLTAHSSKGTQADYVIVIGLTSEGYAFPSQIEDDPVLNLVLSRAEYYPNAEERRLFYVAVTRARRHVYLVASRNRPSSFALEIEREGYPVNIVGRNVRGDIPCPVCKTGTITLVHGPYGDFHACNNYPFCSYRPTRCPRCGEGYLYLKHLRYHCSSAECSFEAKKCPECDGYLVERVGYSRFLGCSNYPDCSHTQSFAARKRREKKYR